MMNEERKQEINKVVRGVFASAGFDYDSRQSKIVPLYEIIGGYSLLITELIDNQRLTSRGAIAAVGQKNAKLSVDDEELSGFLYAAQFEEVLDGWIFTEKSEPTVRRRFSAAHEFGHYLLHFQPQISKGANLVFTEGVRFFNNETDEKTVEADIYIAEDSEVGRRVPFTERIEKEFEANFFAAELLMPHNACLYSAEMCEKQFGANKTMLVRRLASDFLVSFEAMFRRLKDLGFYKG